MFHGPSARWSLWKPSDIIGRLSCGITKRSRPKTSGIVLPLVLLVGGLMFAPAAPAQEQPFDETALIDQYKETVPTASGPKASDGGSGGGGGTPLPPAVVTELRQAVGQEDAKRLEEVATSPEFGAPLHAADEGGLPVDDGTGALTAAVTALADESGGSLLPLLLVLVFSTGALFGAAVHRRRQGLT